MSQIMIRGPQKPAPKLGASHHGLYRESKRPRVFGAVFVGMAAIGLFFFGFGGWAAVAPLQSAVIAQGVIGVEAGRIDELFLTIAPQLAGRIELVAFALAEKDTAGAAGAKTDHDVLIETGHG